MGYKNPIENRRSEEYREWRNETILEYCKVPKTETELSVRLNIDIRSLWCHINPLIKQGLLLKTMPCRSQYQKLVTAEGYDGIIVNDDEIVKYCNEPRSRKDVELHFGIRGSTTRRRLQRLAESGRLKYTIPLNPDSSIQKFIDSKIEIVQFDEKSILDFCKEYKSRGEIANYFGIGLYYAYKSLRPLCKQGKLIKLHIGNNMPCNTRYVTANNFVETD